VGAPLAGVVPVPQQQRDRGCDQADEDEEEFLLTNSRCYRVIVTP